MSLRRNVLIFHSGALGDFVLTWPLAMALGRMMAQARVAYVTGFDKGKLAERAIGVESVDVETGWSALFAEGATLSPLCEKWLSGAGAIYSFVGMRSGDPAHDRGSDAWVNNVRRLAPAAALMVLDPRPPVRFAGHFTEFLTQQFESNLPPVARGIEQMVRSIAQRGIGRARRPGNDWVIHAGSGSDQKCWPVENVLKLIACLDAAGTPTRVILGEAERERLSPADILALHQNSRVVEPKSVTGLLEEFETARVLLANDSGPTHLAAMSGTPTLALFGPSDPTIWRPIGPAVTILHRPTLSDVTVDEVLAAMTEIVAKT